MESIYQMNLNEAPFQLILNGQKTIEMRLNKGERREMKSGDYIIFSHASNGNKIKVQVQSVSAYRTFKELYENYAPSKLGYSPNEKASYEDMYLYYSKEDIKAFGVLAIEIKLVEIIK